MKWNLMSRLIKRRKSSEGKAPVYYMLIHATNVWLRDSKGELANGGFFVYRCGHGASLQDAFMSTVEKLAGEKEVQEDVWNQKDDPVVFWLAEHEIVFLEPGYTVEGSNIVSYSHDSEPDTQRDPSGLSMSVSFERAVN